MGVSNSPPVRTAGSFKYEEERNQNRRGLNVLLKEFRAKHTLTGKERHTKKSWISGRSQPHYGDNLDEGKNATRRGEGQPREQRKTSKGKVEHKMHRGHGPKWTDKNRPATMSGKTEQKSVAEKFLEKEKNKQPNGRREVDGHRTPDSGTLNRGEKKKGEKQEIGVGAGQTNHGND